MSEPSNANTRCPRCGSAFHCGAHEGSCECNGIKLDDALLARLRADFTGCLCMPCLRALQAERGAGAQAPA